MVLFFLSFFFFSLGKNSEEPPKAYVVHAGAEPLYFTNIFPRWTDWDKKDVSENEVKFLFIFI